MSHRKLCCSQIIRLIERAGNARHLAWSGQAVLLRKAGEELRGGRELGEAEVAEERALAGAPLEKGLDDEYKSSLYWEPYCSESSQINLCKPGSTCDSKEESDTPAENCLFNPTCFCLMDSLAGLPSGGGGSGPTCTPQY